MQNTSKKEKLNSYTKNNGSKTTERKLKTIIKIIRLEFKIITLGISQRLGSSMSKIGKLNWDIRNNGLKRIKRKWDKRRKYTDKRCYIFDRKRKIVWGNKNYKISRKATNSEIREILEELGFTGTKKSSTTNSSTTETKPKITKKKKVENKSGVVKQIQDLNEMYKSGIISKEEFDKAKKKILE